MVEGGAGASGTIDAGRTRNEQEDRGDKQNQEFYLSHNWITDIEMDKFVPGMFKLYSVSVIYHRRVFGSGLSSLACRSGINRDSASIGLPRTHLLNGGAEEGRK